MTEQEKRDLSEAVAEPLWECPTCHQRITNTMLQSSMDNFQCAGTFGSQAPRLVRCKAYPTTIFTEPNWDEVQEKLGKILLCQVSGSNMRHVTTGIQKIIDATIGEAMGEV